MKKTVSFFLAFLLVFSLTGTALAAAPTGWESLIIETEWDTYLDENGIESRETEYRIIPLEDPKLDAVLYYSAKMVMESMERLREGASNTNSGFMYRYSNLSAMNAIFPSSDSSDFAMAFNKLYHSNNSAFTISGGPGYFPSDYSEYKVLYAHFGSADTDVLEKLYSIAEEARAYSATHYGQLEYINLYLCDNVEYDGSSSSRGQTTRDAIINGKAVCAGYTSATNDLCFILGIPCIMLLGYNHTWNCVYVDDEWKMLDVTWNDGENPEMRFYDILDYDEVHNYMKYDNSYHIELAKMFVLEMQGYSAAKKYVIDNGIMSGYGDNQYGLTNSLTRAELAVLLTRMNGMEESVTAKSDHYIQACPFIDVPQWAKAYVGYCYESGLVVGYNSTTYGSNDPVTPQALCTVVLRHLDYPETDWSYSTACTKAAAVGLVSQYYPTGNTALRYDVACILYQASKM